jgi:1,4-dihydroxy-2-naphthoyl-CoA synthase
MAQFIEKLPRRSSGQILAEFPKPAIEAVTGFAVGIGCIDLYRFMALSMTEDAKDSHAAWRERRSPRVRGS